MVGVNEVGIRWKDNALIRGGLTDTEISCSYENRGEVSRGHSSAVVGNAA